MLMTLYGGSLEIRWRRNRWLGCPTNRKHRQLETWESVELPATLLHCSYMIQNTRGNCRPLTKGVVNKNGCSILLVQLVLLDLAAWRLASSPALALTTFLGSQSVTALLSFRRGKFKVWPYLWPFVTRTMSFGADWNWAIFQSVVVFDSTRMYVSSSLLWEELSFYSRWGNFSTSLRLGGVKVSQRWDKGRKSRGSFLNTGTTVHKTDMKMWLTAGLSTQ